jgi:hypothetical protein
VYNLRSKSIHQNEINDEVGAIYLIAEGKGITSLSMHGFLPKAIVRKSFHRDIHSFNANHLHLKGIEVEVEVEVEVAFEVEMFSCRCHGFLP